MATHDAKTEAMSPPQPAAPAGASQKKPAVAPAQPPAAARRDWFAIPTPLRRLFRLFPLVTYAPNELPARSPPHRHLPTLYVFVSERHAREGLPSYNPSCLKWQTFLKLAGVEFRLVSSSNHASPTGALPFLIPPSTPADSDAQRPVPSHKLEKYALHKGARRVPEVSASRLDAYQALLDHRIRNAWLYALYLSGPNAGLLHRLYVGPVSASKPVQTTVLYQLRQAAEAEVLQSVGASRVPSDALYAGAEQAFEALAAALGTDDWFFANSGPGLFDAAVFAYTHLLLDEELGWVDTRLRDALLQFPALVEHRNRLYSKCWGKNHA